MPSPNELTPSSGGSPGLFGASALQSAVNLGLSFLNHHWQKQQLAQNEQWAREDAELAYNRSVEQWNRENAYNSPRATMQRYIDAGLNPSLIVGQLGSQNAIGLPSVPQAQSASGNSYFAPASAGDFLSSAMQAKQVELLQSQIDLNKEKTSLTYQQANRIFKLTPKEFEQINLYCDRLQQVIDTNAFQAQVNLLKYQFMHEGQEGSAEVHGRTSNGKWFTYLQTDLTNQIRDIMVNEFGVQLAQSDPELAARKLLAQVLGLEGEATKINLENQKLNEFVKVCSQIYQGQASQASFLGAMADMNKDFFGSLAMSDKMIGVIGKFMVSLVMMLKGSSMPSL